MRGSGWSKSKALLSVNNKGLILGVPDAKALETDLWDPLACQPSSSYGLCWWQGWGFRLLQSLQPSREELAVCAGHILDCTRTSGH